jgi:sugar phosphate isomerase/epimerase
VDIVLHSYTFRDYPLEEAIRAARRYGYSGLELHLVHFNASYPADELKRCVDLASARGVPIACVDFKADLIQEDDRAASEAGRGLMDSLRACAKLGIPRMNGFTGFLAGPQPADFAKNGSAIAMDKHYARCAERLEPIAKCAEDCGVALNLEIHMNTIHDTVAATVLLLDLVNSPALRANPDPGNMFATNSDDRRPASLDKLTGRLGYFHLKNCKMRGDTFDFSVPLAAGDIDYYRVLQRFPALGYTGPVCIEYVGNGDPHVAAAADIRYVENTLAWISDELSNPPTKSLKGTA